VSGSGDGGSAFDSDARPGLRGLDLKPGYDSGDRVLESFYVPVLSRATSYDRSVGYFRSSSLSVAAKGMSRFINGGGTVRLLCGAEVTEQDRDALQGAATMDGAFAERLASGLVTDSEVDARRLEVLAWLAREGRLEVRVAIAIDDDGVPIVGGAHDPYFHEKIGVLRDHADDGIAFQGSVNESATAWTHNFESFSVYTSWEATAVHYSFWANKFEQHWTGNMPGFRVYALPDAARDHLISLAPNEPPDERDPREPAPIGDDGVVAQFLRAAPRLVGSEALAEATLGVNLFPHQQQVVERLAGMFPRSWLVADEVGLGKTISAGMALRRLVLSGQVERALILAPANVCRQWQDELFEKFGLWVPRLDAGKIHGVHPDDIVPVSANANPYADHPILIASSHLARRPNQQKLLLAAGGFDLIIVDEAHHARRSHQQEDRYRPGRLLELLDSVTSKGTAKAVWLLTATPMQVAPVELRDLLVHVGLQGTLADEDAFERYYKEVGRDDDKRTAWIWLDQAIQETPRMPRTGADQVVLDEIRSQVGAVEVALIERFGTGAQSAAAIVEQLTPAGREQLRRWLLAQGPVSQFVTRHSRETLKLYRAQGLLSENLADRDVQPRIIPFDADEQDLYEQLDELIDRLMEAHGSRKGAGFVLTVYRRRLTSSWAAIRKTLTRRLHREALDVEEELLDETVDAAVDAGDEDHIDDAQAIPLTPEEIAEISGYIDRMGTVRDSKFDCLRTDLNAARDAGHSTIVFTQFADTLDDLRDRLVGAYRSQLATFTGAGGRIFRENEGWVDISKRDLVDAIRSRRVTVLLATDAASEGLNLQACSWLINYDAPWNPMRVEQRIGRIDRLGQARDVVHVRSYFIPNTVEESVYAALAARIDDFRDLLGDLQPILGATERAFQYIFRTPRHEREAAKSAAIGGLLGNVDDLRAGGIRFGAEDPLPLPAPAPSPITLEDLREVFIDRYGAVLDYADRPATWDPSRASRDTDTWTALATYGHPRVTQILDEHAGSALPDSSALVLASMSDRAPVAAVRADRTPPSLVRTLLDVDSLGAPAARGEAEKHAAAVARAAAQDREDYEALILSRRRRQAASNFNDRFIALVHSTLADGCAASRNTGEEGADPIAVWFSLIEDPTSGWAYARAFQDRLGVPLATLFPEHLKTLKEPISDLMWTQIRHQSAQSMLALMTEYKSNHGNG